MAASSRNKAILITGAGGEVGHGLIHALSDPSRGDDAGIVALDVRELDQSLRPMCMEAFVGDICDRSLLARLISMYEITEVYHLAALLSTRGEFVPETAHQVNVEGTLNLLNLSAEQARSHGQPVRFIFPSSIAVYGFNSIKAKEAAGAVDEQSSLEPQTIYGCNKLYCEHLGRYYAHHYRQLAEDRTPDVIDFRCIRYPGIISAETAPSGGTSDYGPEMLHAAARGETYACFVRADTRIPFMTMPDAIAAMLTLACADRTKLRQCVYNVRAFNPSAGEFAQRVQQFFKDAKITFSPDTKRQRIVDSWPGDVDDAAARRDFGFTPTHDLESAFSDYLVPGIKARYA
jgi:threonine 3-dehydrogenase